ncbi:tetratricopeptide repeat protein [Litchfieldella rifensis]|uniref:Tetratricopeptide repeat protein n=1 Tax=Litchfieldella rifensis TaxID=762643 RepID=A0ABV7LND0_9GAMM
MRDTRQSAIWRYAMAVGIAWAWPALASAAPALPADMVRNLETLQHRLASGEAATVRDTARSQAERLEGGNAADRWARALYLQLAATAEARDGHYQPAAELLREARGIDGVEREHRDRWLRQEARLRLRAGQQRRGGELLERWLAEHDGDAEDRWLMAQAQASRERWEAAMSWAERAMQRDPEPSETRLALAASVYQRLGHDAQALRILDGLLARAPEDAAQWRRAAGLAQRLGEHGRAAALWEAGWRRGTLSGRDDLLTRIRLHLAGGTPARAAEILQGALADGELADDLEHRRLLAQAWTAARDRKRALAAWRTVAERSGEGDDWLRLGQLAYGWGETAIASSALKQARELGSEEAQHWLVNLQSDAAGDEKTATPGAANQASRRNGGQSATSTHTGA